VLGSLYMGWATPTEAAGVGVAGAVLAAAWNRKLSWAGVRGAVVDTTKVTAMLYWLFFGSSALIGVYTLAGGTKLIQEAMTNLPVGPMGVILIMMLIWIILGCFIDWIGILLLTAPIFVPVASHARLRPGLARRPVLHEHADLVRLAAVRSGRVLPQGRGAAGHHPRRHLPIDHAVHGAAADRARLVIAFPQIALWLPSTMAR
jgi:hypothetical protein